MEIRPFSEDISYGNDNPIKEAPASSVNSINYPDRFKEIDNVMYEKGIKNIVKKTKGDLSGEEVAMVLDYITKGEKLDGITGKTQLWGNEEILEALGVSIQDIKDTVRGKNIPWKKDLEKAQAKINKINKK